MSAFAPMDPIGTHGHARPKVQPRLVLVAVKDDAVNARAQGQSPNAFMVAGCARQRSASVDVKASAATTGKPRVCAIDAAR